MIRFGMRRGYGFLILSLTGLCGAVVLPPKQEDAKAEDVFRNITALKGTKGSELIPSMQFMSAALKVKCDFCHTADRSSDEKRAKQTTREMIAMQNEINAKNFNGRLQVTCATCHAGHTHPIGVTPAEGVEVRPRRSQDIKPADVLAAYGKATGVDPAHPIGGLSLKGTLGTTKTPVETVISGAKFTVVAKTSTGDQKQGFNGSIPWFSEEKGIRKMPLQFAKEFIASNAIYLGPDTLPKITTPSGATAKIGDKDQVVVTGTTAENVRVALYFDKTTSLLSRVQLSYPTILGSIAQVNDYSDYKKVGGVLVPLTVGVHTAERDDVYHYRSARVENNLAPTAFDPPAK